MLLRFTHLGSGHHLHRFRDLGGAANGFDPAPYVPRVRHTNYLLQTLETPHDLTAKSF
jgi:hypothetical protein